MLTASALKSLLAAHHLRLTKRLGQNYLVDEGAIRRVVDTCGLSRTDTVIEIGAGLGALTEPLAEQAGRVMALEVDRAISALLRERLTRLPNVTVLCEDALEFSWRAVADAVVVGAIPYHITSPILIMLGEHRQAIRKAVLILQEEVGDRLLAQPGTKAYGRLSVLGHYCWKITRRFRVPRHAFFPQPEVDSLVLELASRDVQPVAVAQEDRFFEVVKAAFSQRRKTLVNCLMTLDRGSLRRETVERWVRDAGLPLTVRGETLSLAQFARLADIFGQPVKKSVH